MSFKTSGACYSEYIQATKDQILNDYGSIGETGLSHTITGTANLLESHYVSNTAGDYAEVGAQIRGANRPYTYSYVLYPGEGRGKATENVWAMEALNVPSASYINAYSMATNRAGYKSGVSTTLTGTGSSLQGYSNIAYASGGAAGAAQSFDSASGSQIQTSTWSGQAQSRSSPYKLKVDYVRSGIVIKSGSVKGYMDLAKATAGKLDASEHLDSSSGRQIQIQSKYQLGASFFGGLKSTTEESISTKVAGTLTGYEADSQKSSYVSGVQQTGHVAGTFTSTSTKDSASKTRTSDYGTNYDLLMQAKKDSSGSSATGTIGYYVNPGMVDLIMGKGAIQGAVDTAQSGDTVNAAAGTYNENVVLAKPLTLAGAGRDLNPLSNTIITAVQKDKPVIDITTGNVVVKNLQVTGANGETTWPENTGCGVRMKVTGDISDITLENIASKNNFLGLYVEASGNKISDVKADGMVISGSIGDGVSAYAFKGGSISGLSLNGAQISGSQWCGIEVYIDTGSSVSDLSLNNAKISGSLFGVYAYANTGSKISGLNLNNAQISDSGSAGVYAHADTGSSISGLSLENARISNSGSDGVNVHAAGGSSISGLSLNNAQISNSGSAGVYADAVDSGSSLSGWSLDSARITNSGEGVVVGTTRGSISGFSLNNAQISNSRFDGVSCSSDWGSISGLDMIGGTITGSGRYGLETNGDSSSINIVVNHANIYGNTLGGIYNGDTGQIDAQYNYWGGVAPVVQGDVKTDDWVTALIPVPNP